MEDRIAWNSSAAVESRMLKELSLEASVLSDFELKAEAKDGRDSGGIIKDSRDMDTKGSRQRLVCRRG
jgi:hypothetical protein